LSILPKREYVILLDVEQMSPFPPLKSLANNSKLRENIARVRQAEVFLAILLAIFYLKIGQAFWRRRMR
jgi:hypothetical protein